MAELDKFIGKWQVTEVENMDEMLKACDMPEEKRQMYTNTRFTMEYTRDGNTWSYIVYIAPGLSKTFVYKIGEEFNSETVDGRPLLTKVDIEDNKFVEYHHDQQDPSLDGKIVREVTDDDELIVTATVRNVTSTTRHKRTTE